MNLLQVILPVIIMLIIGMICREKKLISEEGIEGFQTLVMNFTLPISLLYTFYRASIKVDTVIFPITLFVVTAGGIFIGKLICKLIKENDAYFPFTMTGYEAGMLGYALFGILLGSDKITEFALMDIVRHRSRNIIEYLSVSISITFFLHSYISIAHANLEVNVRLYKSIHADLTNKETHKITSKYSKTNRNLV